jgi:hypothetical protein
MKKIKKLIKAILLSAVAVMVFNSAALSFTDKNQRPVLLATSTAYAQAYPEHMPPSGSGGPATVRPPSNEDLLNATQPSAGNTIGASAPEPPGTTPAAPAPAAAPAAPTPPAEVPSCTVSGGTVSGGTADPKLCEAPTDLEARATAIDNAKKNKEGLQGSNAEDTKVANNIARAAQFVNMAFYPLINWVTIQIGAFLGNDWIYGGAMGAMLKKIWVTSRNIVNIIMVLYLLYMALAQLIPTNNENTSLKKMLPRFILIMIAVNFTWLMMKVALDAANVATNVVFSLPSAMSDATAGLPNNCTIKTDGSEATGSCMATEFYVGNGSKVMNYDAAFCEGKEFKKKITDIKGGADSGSDPMTKVLKNSTTICWKQMDLKKYNQNTASMFLTLSMGKVQNLNLAHLKLGEANSNKFNDILRLLVSVIFSLVLMIVYLIAFLALFIALIFRTAILWLFVGFGPFVLFVSLIEFKAVEKVKGKFGFDAFFKWAFTPVAVAAVWTVGFIMVTAGQTMVTTGLKEIGTWQIQSAQNLLDANSLFMGMEGLQGLIWFIMTVAIIWMGTFSVLEGLDVVGPWLKKYADKGKAAASALAQSPLYIPIAPLGGSVHSKLLQHFENPEALKHVFEKGYKEILEVNDAYEKIKNEKTLLTTEKGNDYVIDILNGKGITPHHLDYMFKNQTKNMEKKLTDIGFKGDMADLKQKVEEREKQGPKKEPPTPAAAAPANPPPAAAPAKPAPPAKIK